MSLLALTGLLSHQDTTVLILVGASLIILVALWLARRGYLGASISLTMITLTALASIFVWIDQGPRDPAILLFPAILFFGAVHGSRRLFVLLLTFMVSAMGFLVVANVQGWHVNVMKPLSAGTFLDLAALILGLGFVMWVMASDLRRAIESLKAENLRVRHAQGHIEFLAQHDTLTGLPNRTLGQDRLEQAVAQAERNHTSVALVHLDLDDFKGINDSLGHQGGDELLQQVAGRLEELLPNTDTVCRQGGDEFLLVLSGLTDNDEVAGLAIKVQETLATSFRVQGLDFSLTVSLGIALFPSDGRDFDTLLQKADTAMYSAKEAGGNTFRFFQAGMNTLVLEHLRLVAELRIGLAEEQFVLHYQPQYDLTKGTIVGAEALIRWNHPRLGLVPPADFIPAAERSGLIDPLGAWALKEACRQAMAWRTQGLFLTMSVNLSPVQFRRDGLEASLLGALEDVGLPPTSLELELTESMLIEHSPAVSHRMHQLRKIGVSFSIDDFGTGYSNLGYLKRFEVERLKIDKSFILGLPEDPQNETIVRAIIQMAHGLGLGVVAEGIEDEATLARLIDMGCDMGQGFLWAKALPHGEFETFLEAARKS